MRISGEGEGEWCSLTERVPNNSHFGRPMLRQRSLDSLQNWVTTPSPPDATGMNVGFASQFEPQVHVRVVFGWQYAVLA